MSNWSLFGMNLILGIGEFAHVSVSSQVAVTRFLPHLLIITLRGQRDFRCSELG